MDAVTVITGLGWASIVILNVINYVTARRDKLGERLDALGDRLDKLGDRMGALEQRVARIEGRLKLDDSSSA